MNKPSIQEMLANLKPEEYTDFVECMKENYRNFEDEKYTKILKDIYEKPENEAYYNTLTHGCKLAMAFYCASQDHFQMIFDRAVEELMMEKARPFIAKAQEVNK